MPIFAPFSFLQEFISVPTTLQMEYLIVAGGGGGGKGGRGGGGGGGGLLSGSFLADAPSTYQIIVGAGGAGSNVTTVKGAVGKNSSISSSLFFSASIGGGGGGSRESTPGLNGGSGGGGGNGVGGAVGAGGVGTINQGRNGASGSGTSTAFGAGGGGGSETSGTPGTSTRGGNGGTGSLWLDGLRYAGGGGGGANGISGNFNRFGLGGPGGGGDGTSQLGVLAGTGSANTGGGGGGAGSVDGTGVSDVAGGNGGSGIVKVRYVGEPKALGGIINYDSGSDITYHSFTTVTTSSLYYNNEIVDSDALSFINVTETLTTTEQLAINQLVVDLKNAGLWTKMNAIYPFVGGTADTHKWNLKNPQNTDAAYRMGFLGGGWTHNANGITGNGSSSYGQTYMNANTQLNGGNGQNDAHAFLYFRTVTARGGADMGCSNASPARAFNANSRNASNLSGRACMTADVVTTFSTTATSGVFGMSRLNSSNYIHFINKSKQTVTQSSATPPNLNILLQAQNRDGTIQNFQNRNVALFTLGAGLTSDEIDSLVDINATFQTTLGRFV
jgi:hypothetical protein